MGDALVQVGYRQAVKLVWHIGPHKTGTTSLQTSLAARAASGRASYYYPPVHEFGPGHAALAWHFLGLNRRDHMPDAISDEIKRAEGLGYSRVVVSSEEFSRALLTDQSFRQFARVTESVESDLVITLRPLLSRIYPELHELIKNGQKLNLASAHEVLDAMMSRPGLRPDFLSAAIAESGAAAIWIVFVDNDKPEKLFSAMSGIVGDDLPIPRNPAENPSYPFVKAAWLDIVNRHASLSPKPSRAAVDAAFDAATRREPALADVPYPPLPPALVRYAAGVWDQQLAYLDQLQAAGRLRCI